MRACLIKNVSKPGRPKRRHMDIVREDMEVIEMRTE